VPASALVLDDDREAHGLRVVDARHAGEVFERARLVDVDLVRCDLSGCDFSESVWQTVTLVDCRASAIEMISASTEAIWPAPTSRTRDAPRSTCAVPGSTACAAWSRWPERRSVSTKCSVSRPHSPRRSGCT
jgi:hypothetical protein